jgi:methylenetetrahydrofolate dehydrogenase (NADP+)/methenyltetrahydrofolate cyclohydrolase
MIIFNGKQFSNNLLEDLKKRISFLSFKPEFSDILIGYDGPSTRYVKMKKTIAENLGINFISANLDKNVNTEDIILKIKELSMCANMCGIIVQLPLPNHIDTQKVLDSIPLELDVDGLSSEYSNLFYNTKSFENMFIMPTVSAVKKILDQAISSNLENENIVIVGQGRLIGKPITHLLQNKTNTTHLLGGQIKTIDSQTNENLKKEILKNADVIITAVGKTKIINGNDIKDGVIIIDAGTLEVENVLLGDVDFETASQKASFITPTPGGVGPVTVACLMENIVINAEHKNNLMIK